MIIVEIIITFVAGSLLLLGLLALLFRPVLNKLREQLQLESRIEANRRQFEAERGEFRSAALGEIEEWLKQRAGEAGLPATASAASLARLKSPVLQAILERYPLDDRVMELARVYRQATGKELLPESVRQSGEDLPAAAPRALTDEEARLVLEARKEVDGWLSAAAAEQSTGLKMENRE